MQDSESSSLFNALRTIGRNSTSRSQFVLACKEAERELNYRTGNVRDDITGPILDALHSDAGILRKRLRNGLVFDFYYRSKIARDFIMSEPEIPDHVWEPQTTKLLLLLTRHARHVIIGGAYFGEQALLVAKQIKPKQGVCHAFEPNPEQSRMLQHNAKLNRLRNLHVIKKGLWSDDTSVLRLEGEDALAHFDVAGQNRHPESTFGTITIDTYLEQERIERADVIMLDIEGGELRVLQGANRQLELPPDLAPKIIFEVHRKYVDWSKGLLNTDIVRHLTSHGYTVYAVRDFQSNYDMKHMPIEIIPPEYTYLEGPPHGFNMLAVKDRRIIESRPFRVRRGVSPKLLLYKNQRLHFPGKQRRITS